MTAAGPLRVLVCPQEFKGSLAAGDAAEAIARGVLEAAPDARVRLAPMADGGPGTVDVIATATRAHRIRTTVRGPLGDPTEAEYAWIDQPGGALAVIEQAAAAGLVLVPRARLDAMRASTFGVGEQIRDAIARGARRLIVGIGGTATNDGGAGAAQALGLRLLDRAGAELPPGGIHLIRLTRIEAPDDPHLRELDVRIAVDVRNPLLGAEGATAVYGPQKGLHDWQAPALEAALANWAARLHDDLELDLAAMEGVGAGGGLPAGLLAALPGARIESGAALVAETIGLEATMRDCDLVITGEGSLDEQTAYGKSLAHVGALAARLRVPCLAVAGVVRSLPGEIAEAEPLAREGDVDGAMREAAPRAARAARDLVLRWIERR